MASHQKKWASALVIVVIIVVITHFGYQSWKDSGDSVSGFHGWRHQHYEDNPYNGQQYRCGRGHAVPDDAIQSDVVNVVNRPAPTTATASKYEATDMGYPTYNTDDF